jgi:hypothetical protein
VGLENCCSYVCGGCEQALFDSEHKFEYQCGWPAFSDNIEGAVSRVLQKGNKVEITCSRCDGHLGHVFKSERCVSAGLVAATYGSACAGEFTNFQIVQQNTATLLPAIRQPQYVAFLNGMVAFRGGGGGGGGGPPPPPPLDPSVGAPAHPL